MDLKCPKCENTQFSIKKGKGNGSCCVICSECGTVVKVLEDIDFKKHNAKVINNNEEDNNEEEFQSFVSIVKFIDSLIRIIDIRSK